MTSLWPLVSISRITIVFAHQLLNAIPQQRWVASISLYLHKDRKFLAYTLLQIYS